MICTHCLTSPAATPRRSVPCSVLDKVNAHPECEFQEICQSDTELHLVCRVLPEAWLCRRSAAGMLGGRHMKVDIKSFLIGALLVAVAFLGYLYWDRQRNTVEIKLPSFSIEKR